MTLLEAISNRHSVRAYEEKPLDGETVRRLQELTGKVNEESGLHIQLVTSEPKAFDSTIAHYGHFSGVSNYLALIGPKGPDLEEKCGYYGEKLVLEAQRMGLNSCWVALTYRKIPEAFEIREKEKLTLVIALGYGKSEGIAHKSRPIAETAPDYENAPDWFRRGAEAALLAPTAVNQQKYRFYLDDGAVSVKAGFGPCTRIDLGIVKYHFEIGAGKENFRWK